MKRAFLLPWILVPAMIYMALLSAGMGFMFYRVAGELPGMQFFYVGIITVLLIPNAVYFFLRLRSGVFRGLMIAVFLVPSFFYMFNVRWNVWRHWMPVYLIVLAAANIYTYLGQRRTANP